MRKPVVYPHARARRTRRRFGAPNRDAFATDILAPAGDSFNVNIG